MTEEERTIEYEAPQIVDFGDLVELTAGNTSGTRLDADFPAGTVFGDLTFS